VNYERAFAALHDGEYSVAAELLDQAAHETGFASDPINHAYTLALWRAGLRERLAQAALRIGESLHNTDPGSAMDYFQRAFLGGLDRAGARRVEAVLAGWAASRPPRTRPRGEVRRVAFVVGSFASGEATTAQVTALVHSFARSGITSQVFTTEGSAAWFFNPSGAPRTTDSADPRVPVVVASTQGDFAERASRIAASVRAAGPDAVLYHAGLEQQLTARVAAHRPAAVQVNVFEDAPIGAELFEGYISLTPEGLGRVQEGGVPSIWIPPSAEIGELQASRAPATRGQMGLESAGSISATFGDLRHAANAGYLQALGAVLHRFSKHFHLFAGSGNVRGLRSYLHEEGLLPRVRFLNPGTDLGSVMAVVDVYLASFPTTDIAQLLAAMAAGKPTVVMGYPRDSPFAAAAEILSIPELTAPNETAFAEITHRLIRDRETRDRLGGEVESRYVGAWHCSAVGARVLEFVRSL
jgi:hypothetical protein